MNGTPSDPGTFNIHLKHTNTHWLAFGSFAFGQSAIPATVGADNALPFPMTTGSFHFSQTPNELDWNLDVTPSPNP